MTGPRPQPMNPIELLSVLSQLDSRKKQLKLEETRMEDQRAQFEKTYAQAAQQLGFTMKEGHQDRLMSIAKDLQGMTPEQRVGALKVAGSSGLFEKPEMDALTQYIGSVPLTPQTATNQAITRGQPTPGSPEAATYDREAYARSTTGESQTALAGIPGFMAARVPTGQRNADGTPKTLDAPTMAQMVGANVEVGAQGAASLTQRYAGLRLEALRDHNQFLAALKREQTTHGTLSAQDRVLAFQHMAEIAGKFQTSQSDKLSDYLGLSWNGIAVELGLPPEVLMHDPEDFPRASTFFTKLMQKMGQVNQPPAAGAQPPGRTIQQPQLPPPGMPGWP